MYRQTDRPSPNLERRHTRFGAPCKWYRKVTAQTNECSSAVQVNAGIQDTNPRSWEEAWPWRLAGTEHMAACTFDKSTGVVVRAIDPIGLQALSEEVS